MPFLPTVTSQVSARSLRTQVGGPNTVADPDAFGANVGRALGVLGANVSDVGEAMRIREENLRREDTANRVASSDFTPIENQTKLEAPANGAGYYETIDKKYDEFVQSKANEIADDKQRREYVNAMTRQKQSILARSSNFEFALAGEHSKQQTNVALDTLRNKITTDPSMYDEYLKQGFDVIENSTSLPASIKEGAKAVFAQKSANHRFDGMLERATTPAEVDAIAAELAGTNNQNVGPDERKDWTKELGPEDYERMINKIGTVKKEMVTKADTAARAAIDTIEARAADTTALIPEEELKAVQMTVKQSMNPVTVARMARISRDEEIKKQTRTLPPSEIRAQINATSVNPGAAYPGLPPRVSNAVNKASEAFGVPASYLGSMVTREYGQFFKRARPNVDQKFTPVPARTGVDLRNVRPDVVDAATVAGQLFGSPLTITSGYRSAEYQNQIRHRGNPNRITVAKDSQHTHGAGLDITTTGMSGADKGRLVAALADAGFTGFGEYDTHIHADMRAAVPNSFGVNTPTWGGWTNLSPEVMASLKERGFAANAEAKALRRAAPVQMADDIDYGQGTQMEKADGRPASSAVGVAQFTTGTFVQTMRAPGVAQKIGVDISGMSDDQIAELRKDPEISIMAAAALGAQNRKSLESALGRKITDAEMDMAHFLGEGGSVALIRANERNPNQTAASLLPDAAAANRPVFYDGKRERSVAEVYGYIVRRSTTAPTAVAFGDNETRRKIVETKEKNIKEDPVREAQQSGTYAVTSIMEEGGFQERGQVARQIADYYSIPASDMKPFTQDEMLALQKQLETGTADKVLEVMTAVQGLGGDMARAGLKQIGETNATYAYAASLQLETGSGTVAGDIVRGEKRMKENEAIKSAIGASPTELSDAFSAAVGGSLFDVAPREREAIQSAATAHYVETFVARGGGNGFDAEAYGASINAVLGGSRNAPALAEVNGEPTLLPKGVTADQLETALDRMSVEDWTQLSDQKLPPRYVDGTVIDPSDLADEARLRSVGGGKYRIQLSDNTYAVTGQLQAGGRMEAYLFTPDAKAIQNIVNRARTETEGSSVDVPPADDGGFIDRSTFNALGQFDEYGRWLGPKK